MQMEWINFITNLRYMGIGMLSIFIVIGVIVLVTNLLNKLPGKDE